MATNTKSSNLMKLKASIGDGPSSSRSKIDISASKKKVVEGSITIRTSAVDTKNRSASTISKMVSMTKITPFSSSFYYYSDAISLSLCQSVAEI